MSHVTLCDNACINRSGYETRFLEHSGGDSRQRGMKTVSGCIIFKRKILFSVSIALVHAGETWIQDKEVMQ